VIGEDLAAAIRGNRLGPLDFMPLTISQLLIMMHIVSDAVREKCNVMTLEMWPESRTVDATPAAPTDDVLWSTSPGGIAARPGG
jgi:hypothetical protein